MPGLLSVEVRHDSFVIRCMIKFLLSDGGLHKKSDFGSMVVDMEEARNQ